MVWDFGRLVNDGGGGGCLRSSCVRKAARVQWRSGTGDSAHNDTDAFRVTWARNGFRYRDLVVILNIVTRVLFAVFDAFDKSVSGTRVTPQEPSK